MEQHEVAHVISKKATKMWNYLGRSQIGKKVKQLKPEVRLRLFPPPLTIHSSEKVNSTKAKKKLSIQSAVEHTKVSN